MTNTIYHANQMRWTSVALLLLFLGFAYRIAGLAKQPLSADEAFTVVVWNQGDLHQLLTQTALIDPQPPATLVGIVAWLHLVGTTEFAARYLSLLASLITLASLYAIAKSLTDANTALLSASIAVLNPFQLWYAQDIRSYSLWMAVSAFAALALLRAQHQPNRTSGWLIYILATALGLYIFYLEIFFIAGHGLFVLLRSIARRPRHRLWPRCVLALIVTAALAAPWYLRPDLRSSGYHPTAVVSPDLPWIFGTLSFGATLPPTLQSPILTIGAQRLTPTSIVAILLLVAGIAVLLQRRHNHAVQFLMAFVPVPTLLLTLLTTFTGLGFFRPRYLAPASTALIIATGALLNYLLTARRWHAAVGIVCAITIALLSITSTVWYRTKDPKSPPWHRIAAFLETQPQPNDVIVRNFPDPAFDYYYHGPLDRVLLPATPDTPPTETYQTLTDLTLHYHALWFLPVPYVSHDPDQIVAHWLYDNDQLISEHWFDATHILQFGNWDVAASDIDTPLSISYAQTAILRGYNVTPTLDRWKVGQAVSVELFWQPIQRTDPLLTVFFQVLAVDNTGNIELLTQDDQWPQEGRVTTQTWEPGKLYRDVHVITLPPSPNHIITFTTGFYNAETSQRISPDPGQDIDLVGPDSPLLFRFTYN